MKSIEQLKKLEKNPHYTLTDEEKQYLQSQSYTGLEALPKVEQSTSSVKTTSENKKKLTKENVAVKETGKLDKHQSDPVAE